MTLLTKNIRSEKGEVVRDSATHTTDSLTASHVIFYKLTKKFVEIDENIDKKSADVINYALSTGHNTGVVDVFEPCLSYDISNFDEICQKISSDKLKNKFLGIKKFGEITIDKGSAIELESCLDDKMLPVEIARLIKDVIISNQMYLIVRRVSR